MQRSWSGNHEKKGNEVSREMRRIDYTGRGDKEPVVKSPKLWQRAAVLSHEIVNI